MNGFVSTFTLYKTCFFVNRYCLLRGRKIPTPFSQFSEFRGTYVIDGDIYLGLLHLNLTPTLVTFPKCVLKELMLLLIRLGPYFDIF